MINNLFPFFTCNRLVQESCKDSLNLIKVNFGRSFFFMLFPNLEFNQLDLDAVFYMEPKLTTRQ